MKVYIKYSKSGFGPYLKVFDSQNEAMDFVKENNIEIISIDFI